MQVGSGHFRRKVWNPDRFDVLLCLRLGGQLQLEFGDLISTLCFLALKYNSNQ